MPKSALHSAALAKAAADLRQQQQEILTTTHTDRQSIHLCVCVCECACHFINKTNKQSKYIRRRIEAIAQLICCCCICARVNPRGGTRGISLWRVIFLNWSYHSCQHRVNQQRRSSTPSALTSCALCRASSSPCFAIAQFTSLIDAALHYIYLSIYRTVSLSVCASGCAASAVAFTFFNFFFCFSYISACVRLRSQQTQMLA